MILDPRIQEWLARSGYGFADPTGTGSPGHEVFMPTNATGNFNEGGSTLPTILGGGSAYGQDPNDIMSRVQNRYNSIFVDPAGVEAWGSRGIPLDDEGSSWAGPNGLRLTDDGTRVRIGGSGSTFSPKVMEALRAAGVDPASIIQRDDVNGRTISLDMFQKLAPIVQAENAAGDGFLDNGLPMAFLAAVTGGIAGLGAAGTAAGAGAFEGAAADGFLSGAGGFAADAPYWSMLAEGGAPLSDAAAAGAGSVGSDSLWGNLYEQAVQGSGPFSGSSPFTGSMADLQKIIGPNMSDFGSTGQTGMAQSIAPEFPGAQTAASVGPGSTGLTSPSSWWDKLLSNPTSSITKILSGNGTADDYLKTLSTVGSTALGMYGAEKQANALGATADKYLALGAPFRAKLAESYSPGFDMTKQDPAFKGALDVASNSVLKNLSTSGNPFDNPGAVTQAQKYVTDSVALPQLNTYRSQLGTFGTLGTNTAGTADLTKAQTAGSGLDALGYGLGQIGESNNTFEDILKKYGGLLGNKGFNLNRGSSL